jgi:hypothetical protein
LIEVAAELVEARRYGGAAGDQHIIMAARQASRGCEADHFAQSPFGAVAFHRIADLARDREADPRWPLVFSPQRLHGERLAARPQTGRGRQKISPSPQPLGGQRR